MKEIWMDIKGYEGWYQVSNLGRVKSLDRYVNAGYGSEKLVRGKILIPNYKQGYGTVGLSKNQKRKWFNISRLVATEFIPNPNNYPCVNHKDEDKSNNNVENLEWCTHQYNNTYGDRLKGWGDRVSEKLSKKVLQYDMDGNFIRKWDSIISTEKEGFRQGCISNCCSGRTNSHRGYIWKYDEGDDINE